MNGLHGTEAVFVDGGDLADGHTLDAPRKKRGLSRDGPADAAESGASHKRPRRRVEDDVHVHGPRREGLVTQLERLGLSHAPYNSHGVAEPGVLEATVMSRPDALLPPDLDTSACDQAAVAPGESGKASVVYLGKRVDQEFREFQKVTETLEYRYNEPRPLSQDARVRLMAVEECALMAHECSLSDDHLSTLILTTSTEALKALERQDYVIVTEKREVLDQLTAGAKDVEERCRVALSHVHKIEPVLDVNPNSDEHGEDAAFRKGALTRIAAVKEELSRRPAVVATASSRRVLDDLEVEAKSTPQVLAPVAPRPVADTNSTLYAEYEDDLDLSDDSTATLQTDDSTTELSTVPGSPMIDSDDDFDSNADPGAYDDYRDELYSEPLKPAVRFAFAHDDVEAATNSGVRFDESFGATFDASPRYDSFDTGDWQKFIAKDVVADGVLGPESSTLDDDLETVQAHAQQGGSTLRNGAEPKRIVKYFKSSRKDLSNGGTLKTQLSVADRAQVLDWMRNVKRWEVECTPGRCEVYFKERGAQVMLNDRVKNTKRWTLIEVLRQYRDEIAAHYGSDLLVKGVIADTTALVPSEPTAGAASDGAATTAVAYTRAVEAANRAPELQEMPCAGEDAFPWNALPSVVADSGILARQVRLRARLMESKRIDYNKAFDLACVRAAANEGWRGRARVYTVEQQRTALSHKWENRIVSPHGLETSDLSDLSKRSYTLNGAVLCAIEHDLDPVMLLELVDAVDALEAVEALSKDCRGLLETLESTVHKWHAAACFPLKHIRSSPKVRFESAAEFVEASLRGASQTAAYAEVVRSIISLAERGDMSTLEVMARRLGCPSTLDETYSAGYIKATDCGKISYCQGIDVRFSLDTTPECCVCKADVLLNTIEPPLVLRCESGPGLLNFFHPQCAFKRYFPRRVKREVICWPKEDLKGWNALRPHDQHYVESLCDEFYRKQPWRRDQRLRAAAVAQRILLKANKLPRHFCVGCGKGYMRRHSLLKHEAKCDGARNWRPASTTDITDKIAKLAAELTSGGLEQWLGKLKEMRESEAVVLQRQLDAATAYAAEKYGLMPHPPADVRPPTYASPADERDGLNLWRRAFGMPSPHGLMPHPPADVRPPTYASPADTRDGLNVWRKRFGMPSPRGLMLHPPADLRPPTYALSRPPADTRDPLNFWRRSFGITSPRGPPPHGYPTPTPTRQKLRITVPDGCSAGQTIHVQHPNGSSIAVVLPPGSAPGMHLDINI